MDLDDVFGPPGFHGHFVAHADLLRMGFTRTLIERFLTPVDPPWERGVAYAPPRPGQPRPRLRLVYDPQEIRRALEQPVVLEELAKSKERRSKLQETGKRNVELALSVKLHLDPMDLSTVYRSTIAAYNEANFHDIKGGRKQGLTLLDPRLKWFAVQWIRHSLTNYDEAWQAFSRKPGATECWQVISARMAAVVSTAFPELAEAAQDQLNRRKDRMAVAV